MALLNTTKEWGSLSKIFHWTMGILIIGMLAMGLIMEGMDFSPFKIQLYAVHKAIGMIIFAFVALRILWMAFSKRPKELDSYTLAEQYLSRIIHMLLYIGMIGMPLSGWLMSSASNFPISIFGFFTVPQLIAPNEEINQLMKQIHTACAYSLIGAVGLHIIGALKHQFIDKDITVTRMLPAHGSGIAIIMILAFIGFLSSAQLAKVDVQSVPATSEESDTVNQVAILIENSNHQNMQSVDSVNNVPSWQIIPEESRLTFTASQQGAEFEGEFSSFNGEIDFDPQNLAESRIYIEVKTRDVTTGSQDRDGYITNPLWLASEQYPLATFQSDQILLNSENDEAQYVARGTLTLKNITKNADLYFSVEFSGEEDKKKAYATGNLQIKRLDYNVGEGQWKDTGSVGNGVNIDILVHALAKAEK